MSMNGLFQTTGNPETYRGHFGNRTDYRLKVLKSERGKVAKGAEHWVENQVQIAKTIIKRRTTSHPELVLVNYFCLDRALDLFKYVCPEVAVFELWDSERRRGKITDSI